MCVRLVYEGQYLNGERNGYGKEYKGGLIFEGEYVEGERNGRGKEYEEYEGGLDRRLKFDAEYRFGKRNGRGKEYDKDGKLIFDGEFIDGIKNIKFNKILNKYINF